MDFNSEDLFPNTSDQMEYNQSEQASQQSRSILEAEKSETEPSGSSSENQSHKGHPPKRKASDNPADSGRSTPPPALPEARSGEKDCDPFPFLKDYFQFQKATRGPDGKFNVTYRCKFCEKSSRPIKIHETTKSNLFRHMKAHHQSKFKDFSKVVEENHKRRSKKSAHQLSSQEMEHQPSVAAFLQSKGGETSKKGWITQSDLDSAIVKFIVDTGQSFHIVEEDSFISMVSEI